MKGPPLPQHGLQPCAGAAQAPGVLGTRLVSCPNTFLGLYQFWSIYLNIYMNCVMFTSKTPQILTIPFRLLRNS